MPTLGIDMKEETKSCHFLYNDVMNISSPYIPPSLRGALKFYVKPAILRTQFFGPATRFLLDKLKTKKPPLVVSVSDNIENLDLQVGERVQVRSLDEISATLDERGRFKGLAFMPVMKKFCGQEFTVFKRVEKILLESTGELRKLRSPTVFLEGVHCDGQMYEGCDRSCYLYWREAWLKRVPS
jgi:hypothetical protein